MILNKKQQQIVDEALYHIHHGSKQVYEYGGLAGTGKSVVMDAIMERCGISRDRIAPMAYIGQAAIVMRSKGLTNARTIHSWLYEPIITIDTDINGNPIIDSYYNAPKVTIKFVPRDLSNIDLFFIDEGYTVPKSLKADIEAAGKKIIVAGDPGQLPPVKDNPAYLTDPNIPVLDEIMRQGPGSSIVYLADRARKGLPISYGFYNDVLVIDEEELTDTMLLNSPIVICGKNKTRDYYTEKIRSLKGFYGNVPQFGEKVICRKNNWNIEVGGISLANGLIGTVASSVSPSQLTNKQFIIDFMPDMFPYIFHDLHCDYEYLTASCDMKNILKNNPYNKGVA